MYSEEQGAEKNPLSICLSIFMARSLLALSESLARLTIRTPGLSCCADTVRKALAASSGLINAAPDEGSRRFLATQTLDGFFQLRTRLDIGSPAAQSVGQ